MKYVIRMIEVALLAGAASVLAGCASDHQVRADSDGQVTVCRECYDQAVRVWDKGGYTGGRWLYAPSQRVRVEHQCAGCKGTMVVHTENGRWTIQCPGCAPEGVACDKCQPGDAAIKSK